MKKEEIENLLKMLYSKTRSDMELAFALVEITPESLDLTPAYADNLYHRIESLIIEPFYYGGYGDRIIKFGSIESDAMLYRERKIKLAKIQRWLEKNNLY